MNQHLAGDNELSLSVIVPCYNSEQTLAETLEAIANQTCDQPWELIIADNLSTDNSASLAESFSKRFRHFRVITANDGQGTAFAINSGVREARGKSVIFCDSDDVPAAGWLAAMARALAEHEFVACKMDVESLNPRDQFGERQTPQSRGLMKISYPPYLPHAGGSTLGIRRKLFLELGGYDPFFIYLHETDFCFRTQLAGHALTFVPDAVLAVRFRRDRKSTFKQSYRWGEYNILLFKRYKSYGALPKHRWKRLFLELRYVISQLFRWYKLDDGQKMRTLWLLGWLLGKFKGMIRYRTGPY